MRIEKRNSIVRLTFSAVCLALCLVLPLLTGQIPKLGSALCPMHLPVLLCGFICGWPYGLVVGFIAPLLRFFIFGMPPLFPTGVAMMFELATYGIITGIFSKALSKRNIYTYFYLFVAMLAGRAVWGSVMFIISAMGYTDFSLNMFLTGAFINAVPGIIIQFILVPVIVFALKKAKIIKRV